MPKVQVFLMGAGTWLTGDSLAAGADPGTVAVPRQRRQSPARCGVTVELAEAAGPTARIWYIADPHNPVPSLGDDLGADGPVCTDQRAVECRADVLVYSTAALTAPVTIAGRRHR